MFRSLTVLAIFLTTLPSVAVAQNSAVDPIAQSRNFRGHDSHRADAGFSVVENGKALATVVLPDYPLPVHRYAAEELVEHIRQATGVTLAIESQQQATADLRHIYVGPVKAMATAGVAALPPQMSNPVEVPVAQVKVSAPDVYRLATELTPPLNLANNTPSTGDAKVEETIDLIVDLGEVRTVAALTVGNRALVATNYNIGRIRVEVGAADDGKSFDRVVAEGAPLPEVNAASVIRSIPLGEKGAEVRARYLRVRVLSNFFGKLGSSTNANSIAWQSVGYKSPAKPSPQQAGLPILTELPASAFFMKSSGNALFLVGRDEDGSPLSDGTKAGTLFAVYEWLERQLGVHWVWPGELGTHIPKTATVRSGTWDVEKQPAFLHTRMRMSLGKVVFNPGTGGFTKEQRDRVIQDEMVWYRRNRYARGVSLDYGHGYIDYWQRFHESHPEYFNLLPDGTRRSDPMYYGGAASLVSMSVGDSAFQKQVVADWKERRTEQRPWINGWENDTHGKCTCPLCLNLDVPDPSLSKEEWSKRTALARQSFTKKERDWDRHLGSLSDRYARYFLALQSLGRAVDPGATVIGGAYANYAKPPLQTKLNPNIVVGVVPTYGWPIDEKAYASFQTQWSGWRGAGASMYLRPNYTLWGHEQPLMTARQWAKDFKLAASNGMIGTDYDSLTSMWATQGPSLYVLTRLHWRPEMTVDEALNEYYEIFGPASKAVQRYVEFWERESDAAATRMSHSISEAKEGAVLFSHWASFHNLTANLFEPDAYSKAATLLDDAKKAAGTDTQSQRRIEFLRAGLEDARLVAVTSRAYSQFQVDSKDAPLAEAIAALDRYRAKMVVDFPNALNIDLAAWLENRHWNRPIYASLNAALSQGEIVQQFPTEWRLRWDPGKAGAAGRWFAEPGTDAEWQPIRIDAPWEKQATGKQWREAHGEKDYDGMAWYRVRFKVDEKWRGRKLNILFGAVDEAATVYLNGRKIGEHPYVQPNDWEEPFTIETGDALRFDGENELVVLVEDNTGAGGIWKPVWLIAKR